MELTNIVIASPMHNQIQQLKTQKELKNNFRFLSDEDVTQEDILWADALASFSMKGDNWLLPF